MNKSFSALLKTKRLGRYCKAGAWSIFGLGALYIVVYSVYIWKTYQMLKDENGISSPSVITYSYLFPAIGMMCQVAIFSVFGFTVLSLAGTIFNSLATSLAPAQDETEDIVYEPLDEPIKMRK